MWREGKRGRLAGCGGGGRRASPPAPALPTPSCARATVNACRLRLFDGGQRSARRRDARRRPDGARGRLPVPGGLQAPEPRRRRPAISPRGVLRIDPSSTAVQPPLFLGGARRSWPWEICRGPCGRMPLLVICRVAQGRPQPAQGRTWERRDVRPPRGAAVHLHRSTPSTAPSRSASHATRCVPTDTRRAGACGRDDSGLRRGCYGVPAGS